VTAAIPPVLVDREWELVGDPHVAGAEVAVGSCPLEDLDDESMGVGVGAVAAGGAHVLERLVVVVGEQGADRHVRDRLRFRPSPAFHGDAVGQDPGVEQAAYLPRVLLSPARVRRGVPALGDLTEGHIGVVLDEGPARAALHLLERLLGLEERLGDIT
jgi:hypothetical protein